MFDKTILYPTVNKGLQILSGKGFKLAVVTNKPQEPCEKILTHLGIADKFDIIMGATPQYKLKPDPEMLFAVMDATDSSPENSWMVGDNYTDLESGRYAGVKTCLAKYGFGRKQKENYNIAVDSFVDFAKLL